MVNTQVLRDAEQRRLAWRCRRGLLELDIVLQEFVSKQYISLSIIELQVLDEMLALADNEFWDLINGTKELGAVSIQQHQLSANAMLEKLRAARPSFIDAEAN